MSLLLDALKRAEEAKRAKLTVEAVPGLPATPALSPVSPGAESTPVSRGDQPVVANIEPPEFRLEDYPEVTPAKANIHSPLAGKSAVGDPHRGVELSLENSTDIRSVEGAAEKRLLATPATAAPAIQSRLDATSLDAAKSRDTARNVFAAKHATSPDEGSRKKWLLPAIAVMLLAAGGGGWYVWNQVNRMSRPAGSNIAAPRPPAQPVAGQPGARQQDENAARLVAPVEPPLPPLLPPLAEQAPLPKLALPTPANTSAPLTQREALAKSLKDAPVSGEAAVELKLARSIDTPAVSPDLVEAYAALKNADYQRARALYAKVVLADPLNPDAQLGMATAFARSGDSASAVRHYRQVLVIDPRNGVALAGLLAVSDTRSLSLEVELKSLTGRNPDTASLRFALGNLYASERRWVEAQQAYFEAYRLESDNADYMYNLAVSLDQLKQAKLALNYYQKALAARSKAGGQFDPAAVTRRIKDLTTDSRNN